MKPGEPTRFACGECQIGFDITVAPWGEWREQFQDGTEPDEPLVMAGAECPFCGARELRQASDAPTITTSE